MTKMKRRDFWHTAIMIFAIGFAIFGAWWADHNPQEWTGPINQTGD